MGCSSASNVNLKKDTPVNLYAQGLRALKEADYPRAGEDFDAVLMQPARAAGDFYLLTTIRAGDVLFAQGNYAQAKSKYKRVIDSVQGQSDLPNVDYALFRLIQTHWMAKGETFFLVPPMDRRDQTEINAAYRLSRQFIANFPNSPYMPEVMALYKKIVDTKISFEMEVARYYLVRHKPMGAVLRMERLLKKVPAARFRKAVIRRYIRALKSAGKTKEVEQKCTEYKTILGKEPCKG